MDNEQIAKIRNIDSKSEKLYSFNQKQILMVVIVVLVIIAGLWIWKVAQIKSVKNEYNNREQAMILASAKKTDSTNRQFLTLLAKPFIWAVRTELMQGNIGQLNLYGSDIVKEKNFLSVMVADLNGIVISSTDKKYEGKKITSIQPSINLQADSTIVGKINDSSYIVTSPIMSFNSKLGTLIMNYASVPPPLMDVK